MRLNKKHNGRDDVSNEGFLSWRKRKMFRQKNSCDGNTQTPKCLGDLNDWARDTPPSTTLDKYCIKLDNQGKDLKIGEHCVANCANIKNREGWVPGGKIKRTSSGFEWQKDPTKNPKYFVKLNDWFPTKKEYCKRI
jgi:hypothetical protein